MMKKEERDYALKYLNATTNEMMEVVESLSEEQLKFKPNTESWSVAECVKHIMLSEINVWGGFVDAPLTTEPDPTRRAEVKMTDAQVANLMENNFPKVKTYDMFNPKLRPETVEVTIKEFKGLRSEHTTWTKETEADLRNSYAETPFGVIDSYQAIIFVSAHTRRHVMQMKKVMASPNFPSK